MDVVNIIGFGIDSTPAEQGAKRTNSALDSVSKKADETAKTAQRLGKEMGEAFKLQSLTGAFQQVQSSLGSLGGMFQRVSGVISGTFQSAINQASGSLSGLKAAFAGAGGGGGGGGAFLAFLGLAGAGLAAFAAAAGVALVAAVAITAQLFEMSKRFAETGAKLFDLSDKTGISVKNLNLFRQAAAETGKGIDIVERSFDQFTSRLEKASKEKAGSQLGATFKALGVDAKTGLQDVDKSLATVVKSLNSIENSAIRGAKAQEIFGLRNEQIVPILSRIGGGLDEYDTKLGNLGKITEEQAKASKSFELSLNLLTNTFSGIGAALGATVLPAFQSFIDLVQTIVKVIASGLLSVLDSAKANVNGLSIAFDILNAAFRSAPAFIGIVKAALTEAGTIFGRLGGVVSDAGKTIGSFLAGDFAGAAANGAGLANRVTKLTEGIGQKTTSATAAALVQTGLEYQKIQAERARLGGSGRTKTLNEPTSGADKGADALRNAQIAAQKAYAAEELKLVKDQIQREEKALKDFYDDGIISASEYYRSRFQIASGGIDKEIGLLAKEQAALEKQQGEIKGKGNKEQAERLRLEVDILKIKDDQIIKQRESTAAIREEVSGLREANAELLKGLALKPEEINLTTTYQDQLEKLPPVLRRIREERAALFGRANVDFLGNSGTEGGRTFSRSQQLESGLRAEQAAVQARVNSGVESELDARKEILLIESKYRDALIDALAAERDLAASAGDLSKAFDIQGQIEGLKNFGRELTNSQRLLKGLQDTKSIGDKFEELGGNIKSSLTDAFRAGFETGPKGFFDSLKSNFKRTLAQMAADFATSKLLELLFGKKQSLGSAPAATGASGGGGVLGSLSSLVSGNNGGQASGGGGIGSFLTGGFAGGPNPAAGGSGSGGGGLLGGLLGLFRGGGGAKSAASAAVSGGEDFAGALNAISGGGGKAAGGIGGFLSKIPILGKLFGGGGAGGAGAATGLSSLINPVGLAITGALIAAPFIAKLFGGLFGGGELKKFSKETESLYAVKIKNDKEGQSVYQQAKQIGEQAFGKGKFASHIKETIGIKEVKDLIAQYGLSTGQDNSPLVKRYQATQEIGQVGNGANNFTRRAFGGDVFGGGSYLVGDGGRSEVFKPKVSGTIFPSIESYLQSNLQSQMKLQLRGFGGANVVNTGGNAQEAAGTRAVLGQLIQVLGRLGAVDKGTLLQMLPAEDIAQKASDGYQRNTTAAIKTQRVLGVATT